MACRGVFFALTKEEEAKLLAAPSSDAVVEIITEEIEERRDRNWLVEVDKSWDAGSGDSIEKAEKAKAGGSAPDMPTSARYRMARQYVEPAQIGKCK
jgi:hypothetical protein